MTLQQVLDRLERDKGTPLEALWRAALRMFELETEIKKDWR